METEKTNKNSVFTLLTIVLAIMVISAIGSHFFKHLHKSFAGTQAPPVQIKQWITSPPPDLNGRVYVLDFWATWCSPCVRSIPHMIELTNKYKDVAFIAVSLDRSPEPVKTMVQNKGINYHVGMDNGLSEKYSVRSIPSSFVIDRAGRVAWRGHPMEPGFEPAIAKALNTPPSVNSDVEE
jgi:thiol-disulfide isomerase/thioredoxin